VRKDHIADQGLEHAPQLALGPHAARRRITPQPVGPIAGAFRRSELVALTVADLVDAPDGYRVMIRRSKTDQEGAGQEIAIPRGCRIETVKLVQAWLRAAGITEGPVFRPVLKGSRVPNEPLSGHSAAAIVKRYALATSLDPAAFAGHSLRAGFLTSAAESGASVLKMVEVSRHKSVDMLTTYVRRSNLFREHAVRQPDAA
jgi:integrase